MIFKVKKTLQVTVIICIFSFFPFHAYAQKNEDSTTSSELSQSLNSNVEQSLSVLNAWQNTDIDMYNALRQAYTNNPTLLARRAEFIAVKEELPLAQAGFQPSVNADADVTYTNVETDGQNFGNSDGGNTSKTIGVTLDQPLFRGGTTLANIKAANAIIAAQKAAVYAAEQQVMSDAVTAYMDVMYANAALELTKNNKNLIERELEQAQARFDVGELTRTDVAQAKARLSLAEASMTQAQGDLRSQLAVYEEIIGNKPDLKAMALPASVLKLPAQKEEAMQLAALSNLSVIIAENVEIAAQHDVDSTFGELLPQVSAVGSLARNYTPSSFVDEQDRAVLGIQASIPLYQSGATRSRLRQAKQVANQRFLEVYDVKNQARREAATNLANWNSAQAEIESRKAQVEAASIAREGVHYEAEFGERTTLDTLDANQELLNAQLDLIAAYRNEVVARFALANTLGLLTPQNLDLYEDR